MNLLLLVVLTSVVQGQILPLQDAKLNYTQIMFEHPKVYGADEYLVQVDEEKVGGTFMHPVKEGKDSSMAMMLSNFEFGKKYTWRYTGLRNGKKLGWNGPYSFEILTDNYADKKFYRLRVLSADKSAKEEGLLVLDETRTIADRNGNFVWFLPADDNTFTPESEINDLRITPAGTLTFLEGRKAFETDLNGNKLWAAPKDSIPADFPKDVFPHPYTYHHCFRRLANGNYMLLCKVSAPGRQAPPVQLNQTGSAPQLQPAGSPMSTPVPIGGMTNSSNGVQYDIIKEFDKKGNVVWTWSSRYYFTPGEIKDMMEAKQDSGPLTREPGGHLNAFDVDEKNGFVFAGFRNVSRVIKIDYKTGKSIHSWGAKMLSGGADEGDGFFSKQHDVTLMRDGSIAVFNNGSLSAAQDAEPSSVVIFSQPEDGSRSKVIWNFECKFDGIGYHSIRGGNVNELKNGNLLVSMGWINRIFEVTRNKRLVWQGVMEKYNAGASSWQPEPLYKVSYTSSLYPCYFTAVTNLDTLTENAPSFKLKIFNNGSEDDTYTVKISSPNSDYKKQFNSEVVQNGKSVSFEIAPDNMTVKEDSINVLVASNTNQDFVRKLSLRFVSKSGTERH